MNVRRNLLLLVTLATAAGPAWGQQAAPAAGQANVGPQSAASIPDFSGIWRHGNLPWFIPPASGPGPVTNLSLDSLAAAPGQCWGGVTVNGPASVALELSSNGTLTTFPFATPSIAMLPLGNGTAWTGGNGPLVELVLGTSLKATGRTLTVPFRTILVQP